MEKNKPTVYLHKKDAKFWKANTAGLIALLGGATAFIAHLMMKCVREKIDEQVAIFAEDQGLDYHAHNALRLICRSRLRNREGMIKDLEKAAWYINRSIKYKRTQQLLTPKHDPRKVLDSAYKKRHCVLHSKK